MPSFKSQSGLSAPGQKIDAEPWPLSTGDRNVSCSESQPWLTTFNWPTPDHGFGCMPAGWRNLFCCRRLFGSGASNCADRRSGFQARADGKASILYRVGTRPPAACAPLPADHCARSVSGAPKHCARCLQHRILPANLALVSRICTCDKATKDTVVSALPIFSIASAAYLGGNCLVVRRKYPAPYRTHTTGLALAR